MESLSLAKRLRAVHFNKTRLRLLDDSELNGPPFLWQKLSVGYCITTTVFLPLLLPLWRSSSCNKIGGSLNLSSSSSFSQDQLWGSLESFLHCSCKAVDGLRAFIFSIPGPGCGSGLFTLQSRSHFCSFETISLSFFFLLVLFQEEVNEEMTHDNTVLVFSGMYDRYSQAKPLLLPACNYIF